VSPNHTIAKGSRQEEGSDADFYYRVDCPVAVLNHPMIIPRGIPSIKAAAIPIEKWSKLVRVSV
jgi:hypothetical protein